jgi:hypothetical protein
MNDHKLVYVVDHKKQKPYRVSCSHCRQYIHLSLTGFYHYETERKTGSFFEAMAGECKR